MQSTPSSTPAPASTASNPRAVRAEKIAKKCRSPWLVLGSEDLRDEIYVAIAETATEDLRDLAQHILRLASSATGRITEEIDKLKAEFTASHECSMTYAKPVAAGTLTEEQLDLDASFSIRAARKIGSIIPNDRSGNEVHARQQAIETEYPRLSNKRNFTIAYSEVLKGRAAVLSQRLNVQPVPIATHPNLSRAAAASSAFAGPATGSTSRTGQASSSLLPPGQHQQSYGSMSSTPTRH